MAFDSNDGQIFIMRVIGQSGDKVQIDSERLSINQQTLVNIPVTANPDNNLFSEMLGEHRYTITIQQPIPNDYPTINERISEGSYFVLGRQSQQC